MNICEGSFYESRDGEGYVYVKEREGNDISYIACSNPTKKALTAADAYIGTMSRQEMEDKIVYPYCERMGYTAWADVPMEIHEASEIRNRLERLHKDIEELRNIISGIFDRGDADENEYEGEEYEA